LIVPPNTVQLPYISGVARKLTAFRNAGGRVVSSARYAGIAHAAAGGIPNAVLLVSSDRRFGFLDVVNYARTPLHTKSARVHAGPFSAEVPALTVAPRDAVLLPLHVPSVPQGRSLLHDDNGSRNALRLPLRGGSWVPTTLPRVSGTRVYTADVYQDGYPAVVFENDRMRLIVSPCAGARAFVFEDKRRGDNLFTTIGGLRDAWQQTYPPSPRDYIAKYTHPIATGTFNRCYRVSGTSFTYTVTDAPPHGAAFKRLISIDGRRSEFALYTRATFPDSSKQQAQQLTSFAMPQDAALLSMSNGYGIFEPSAKRVVMVAWPGADVQTRRFDRHDADGLLTLTYAQGGSRVTWYGFTGAASLLQAKAALRNFTTRTRTRSVSIREAQTAVYRLFTQAVRASATNRGGRP
jgi:hypothetical protein